MDEMKRFEQMIVTVLRCKKGNKKTQKKTIAIAICCVLLYYIPDHKINTLLVHTCIHTQQITLRNIHSRL